QAEQVIRPFILEKAAQEFAGDLVTQAVEMFLGGPTGATLGLHFRIELREVLIVEFLLLLGGQQAFSGLAPTGGEICSRALPQGEITEKLAFKIAELFRE